MSFKDVRDLSEHLKLLGFPKVFPLQALCSNYGSLASFQVVAEILQWLAGLLEPGTILSGSPDTEAERVLLIRSATEFFVTKSAIKLNPRKLYASSAATAGELQKITKLLIAPSHQNEDKDEDENYRSLNQVDIGDKIDDLRRARELSSDLTNRGAALYDLLSKEVVNKESRIMQANRPMEISSVERSLKNAISAAQLKLQSSRVQLESSKVEFNALSTKLQRKKAELERTKQRLEALEKIRPAHLQEFEQYETELKELFQQYFLRIHCRDALKAQIIARSKKTAGRPISSPIQKPAESSMHFLPEGLMEDDDDDDFEGNFDDNMPFIRDEDLMMNVRNEAEVKIGIGGTGLDGNGRELGNSTTMVRPTTGRNKPRTGTAVGRHKVVGSMLGGDDDNLDSSLGSSDSDVDIGGEDYELNTDDEISLSKLASELPMRPKTANKQEHHSDEDF
ncbi:clusterin-associated protein 1 [Episyrphus balteatus]|uniref:clusterin-associated protein 1 n=1 Tax=Episyrphus balteatus TaxID=286459 RepID=UPI002485EEA6|nr:clusterin-associated protein 1 [Episyrphus balteatus]